MTVCTLAPGGTAKVVLGRLLPLRCILENVAVATHCSLRPSDALITTPVPRFKSDNRSVRYSVFIADKLRYAVILIFDPLTLDISSGQTLYQYQRNRASSGAVIVISVFDLITLNM